MVLPGLPTARSHSASCTTAEPGIIEFARSPRRSLSLEHEPLAEPGSEGNRNTDQVHLKIDTQDSENAVQTIASPTRRRAGVPIEPPFQEAAEPPSTEEHRALRTEEQPQMMQPLSPVPQTQSSGETSPVSVPSPEGTAP